MVRSLCSDLFYLICTSSKHLVYEERHSTLFHFYIRTSNFWVEVELSYFVDDLSLKTKFSALSEGVMSRYFNYFNTELGVFT